MQSFLIVGVLQKFADTGARLREIAVFVAVDLLVFQCLDNDSQAALSYGLPLRLMLICASCR